MKKPNGIVPPDARGVSGKTDVSTKGQKRRRRAVARATPEEHHADYEAWARRAIDAKRMPKDPESLAVDNPSAKPRILPDLSKK